MLPSQAETVSQLCRSWADAQPDAIAIQALNAADLTYRGVVAQIDDLTAALTGFGIGHGDRVMIQLPNGAEPLLALHGVGAVAIALPVDPRAGATELDYLMTFAAPKAILLQQGVDSSGRALAQQHGVRILDIIPTPEAGAGTFDFAEPITPGAPPILNGPNDISYLISTSGTTALPKLIPRTQTTMLKNIELPMQTQFRVLGETLPLRTINYMPMNLMFGYMAASAALASGGVVACMPGFDISQIFYWLDTYQPRFVAATPAMIEQIVAAARTQDPNQWRSIRYLYTGASPLSEAVSNDLRQIFGLPIVHVYGMTELGRVAQLVLRVGDIMPEGLVGQPPQPDFVRIVDADGSFLPANEVGEVVAQPDLFLGYWNNPEANAEAILNGWFRTGDMGYFDADGNLYLTGRIKEVINIGGAKVSPYEVEAVLRQHPQVKDAAVFGLKHAEVGETVAAAVVGDVTERDLRRFAAERLPFYKVPTRIVVVDEIPRAASSKVQRNQLATLLGLV